VAKPWRARRRRSTVLPRAEWTGIKLSVLLDEAGMDPSANWLLAEGADAAGMDRSIPMKKAMDDAMIALYQNGERLRPSNGYPMRLPLPGMRAISKSNGRGG
jgi:sulfane dehydrogenase subunit SoxC